MEAKRKFKGSDMKMLAAIRKMHTHFTAEIAAFTAFDPSLDAAFLAAWDTAQENAWVYHSDEQEVIEGEILMEEAVTALDQCREKYRDVKYYAGKAFPNSKEAMKEFGEGQYSKLRNSPLKMVQFMETLHGVATKYKNELITAGFSQAAIDEIAALTTQLRNDNKAQQMNKKERPTETRKRIETLNTYYGFGQQVAAVAPLVFRNSYAKRHLFRLAEKHHPKVPKSWFTVAPNELRKTAITRLLKKYKLTLTNQGAQTIPYWQANNIKETPAQKNLLNAGESVAISAETPVKKFLIVENTSAREVRMMITKEPKK